MNGHEQRREKKKKDIMAAAHELFLRNKYNDVKVEEIAKLAHVSPASIYNYFGTKQTLLIETLRKSARENWERVYRKLDEATSFYDQLMFLFKGKIDAITQNKNLLENIDVDESVIKGLIDETEDYWGPIIHKLIERSKADGATHPQLSERAVFLYIKCIAKGIQNIWDTVVFENTLLKELIGLFYFGLSGPPDLDQTAQGCGHAAKI